MNEPKGWAAVLFFTVTWVIPTLFITSLIFLPIRIIIFIRKRKFYWWDLFFTLPAIVLAACVFWRIFGRKLET